MLNLDQSATIEDEVQERLNLVPVASRKKEWGRKTNDVKSFKAAVKAHGMNIQGARCVWCEAKIGPTGRRTPHRDHIAPKDLYESWTFEPDNLAMSCEFCNGFEVKKDLDTIEVSSPNYQDCIFRIVHPYFDDPSLHIGFVEDEDDDTVVMVGLSDKGIWTIENMDLDGTTATSFRAMEKSIVSMDLSEEQLQLIRQAMEGFA